MTVRRSQASAVALVAAALAAVVGWVFLRGDTAETTSAVPDPGNGRSILMEVGNNVAVIQSPRETRAIDRSGRVMWAVPVEDINPQFAACSSDCDPVVLSGNLDAAAAPLAQDPQPEVRGTKRVPGSITVRGAGKNLVLAANQSGGLRVASDANGKSSLYSDWKGQQKAYPLATPVVDWFPTSDGAAGLLSNEDGDQRVQQAWALGSEGWRPTGPAVTTDGSTAGFGCAARGGNAWFAGGQIRRASEAIPLSVSERTSNCAFTTDRLVTTAYEFGANGAATTVAVFDFEGKTVRKAFALDGEYWMTAQSGGTKFALVGNGEARVLGNNGRTLTTIAGVVGGRFAPNGDLVVLDDKGGVRWIKV